MVNKQLFKSIYAQGIQLKFVKLLFLHLKHSIRKYIVTKEATKKQQNAQKNKTESQRKRQGGLGTVQEEREKSECKNRHAPRKPDSTVEESDRSPSPGPGRPKKWYEKVRE